MEIASLPIEFNKDQFDSRYRLITAAVQRTRQLMLEGAKSVISSKYTKETMIALEETLESKMQYLRGEDARVALREAARTKGAPIGIEDEEKDELTKEIKKELSVYMAEHGQKNKDIREEEDAEK